MFTTEEARDIVKKIMFTEDPHKKIEEFNDWKGILYIPKYFREDRKEGELYHYSSGGRNWGEIMMRVDYHFFRREDTKMFKYKKERCPYSSGGNWSDTIIELLRKNDKELFKKYWGHEKIECTYWHLDSMYTRFNVSFAIREDFVEDFINNVLVPTFLDTVEKN